MIQLCVGRLTIFWLNTWKICIWRSEGFFRSLRDLSQSFWRFLSPRFPPLWRFLWNPWKVRFRHLEDSSLTLGRFVSESWMIRLWALKDTTQTFGRFITNIWKTKFLISFQGKMSRHEEFFLIEKLWQNVALLFIFKIP